MKTKILLIALCLGIVQNIFSQESKVADNAFIAAVKQNKYEIVKSLLPNVAGKINYYDIDGFTALMYATEHLNDSIIQLLLDYGADPNLESEDKNVVPAITNVVLSNSPRILDLMLQYHGNPNLVDSVKSCSLLHYAVDNGYLECADVLLFHRANPNLVSTLYRGAFDSYQRNPLQVAVNYSDTLMIQLLLDYGANVNAKPDNISPLCLAVYLNDYATAKYLLNHGADVNLPSKLGAPIVYSVIYADSKMSQLLIDHGAKLDAKDSDGNNLATISQLYEKRENLKYFESQGIKNSQLFIPSAVTLSLADEFCKNENRMSFRLGVLESHFNVLLYMGVSFRPSYETAYVQRGDKSYWQLREKLTMMQIGIEKRISFKAQRRPDVGAYVGYQFSYCSGKYDGSIDQKPKTQVINSPSIGLYQRFSGIGISSGYRYYGYDNTLSSPKHVAEISMTFYINFNRAKALKI